jgi:flagellar capping protein FliD
MSTSSIVNTLGAGSGIDVKSLAQSLVDAEKTPKKERIEAKITQSETRISGYSAVKFALSELKNAFSKLNDANEFASVKASNNQPSAFGVTTSSAAGTGSYSLEVSRIATEQRTASEVFATEDTTLNGGLPFTLNLQIGNKLHEIKVEPKDVNNNLRAAKPADVVSAINGAKSGVTAQLLNTGSGFQIVLSGQTGAANSFSLSTNSTQSSSASVELNTAQNFVVNAAIDTNKVTASYDDDGQTVSLDLVQGQDGKWRPQNGVFLPAGKTFTLAAEKPVTQPSAANLETHTDSSFEVSAEADTNKVTASYTDADNQVVSLLLERGLDGIWRLPDGVTIPTDKVVELTAEKPGAQATSANIETNTAQSFVVNAAIGTNKVTASYDDNGQTVSLDLVQGQDGKWQPQDGVLIPAGITITLAAEKPMLLFSQRLQTAENASFKLNGLTITRTTNSINDVIEGVTFNLFSATPSPARLDLSRETVSIKDNIQGLVTAYNDFEETLKILGDRASEVEEFGGALAGDNLLQSVRNQVRSMITSDSSTPGKTIKAARDVGLSIDRYGKLTLDESKLDTALQKNFAEVSTMFSAGTNNQSIYSAAPAGLAGGAINSIEKMLRSTSLIETQTKNAASQIVKHKEDLKILDERMEKLMNRYMSQFSVMESLVGNSNSMREGLKSTFEGMMKAYGN